MCRKIRKYPQVTIRQKERKKIHHERCQQNTDLRCDTLTMSTWYPLQKWLQILLQLYSALIGKYGNATARNVFTAKEVNDRKNAGRRTPHQNSVRHLVIVYVQQSPHTFLRYIPRQRIRTNYLGCRNCNTNPNNVRIRTWHKMFSTVVPRQRQPSGIHLHWWHRYMEGYLIRTKITIEEVY